MPSERNFGLWFTVIAAGFGVFPVFRSQSLAEVRWPLLSVAVCFLFSALVVPRILRPLNLAWYRFGLALGRIVNPILMAVVFLGVVTPIGLLKTKVFGSDPLRREFDPVLDSYWITRTDQPASMRRQF